MRPNNTHLWAELDHQVSASGLHAPRDPEETLEDAGGGQASSCCPTLSISCPPPCAPRNTGAGLGAHEILQVIGTHLCNASKGVLSPLHVSILSLPTTPTVPLPVTAWSLPVPTLGALSAQILRHGRERSLSRAQAIHQRGSLLRQTEQTSMVGVCVRHSLHCTVRAWICSRNWRKATKEILEPPLPLLP